MATTYSNFPQWILRPRCERVPLPLRPRQLVPRVHTVPCLPGCLSLCLPLRRRQLGPRWLSAAAILRGALSLASRCLPLALAVSRCVAVCLCGWVYVCLCVCVSVCSARTIAPMVGGH
jgi:hypothetical protein